MSEHKGLPVAGYVPQSEMNVALVNQNKELEERVLRQFDLMKTMSHIDQRMLAIGRTSIETAFMWANRSVFQPQRVKLPDDGE